MPRTPAPPARSAPPVSPMRVRYTIGAPVSLGRAVCAVSAFDGVHRGHRELAERAAALAAREDAAAVAAVLWEGERPTSPGGESAGENTQFLALLDERLALLGALGLFDAALVLSRAPDAPALDADGILTRLRSWAEPVAALAADDLNGLRAGLASGLAASATREGIRAEALSGAGRGEDGVGEDGGGEDGVGEDGRGAERERGSARTSIGGRARAALLAGDTRAARELLGHAYGVEGEVVGGDRRGRLLGYPTANLRIDPRKLLPADGVYAARARLPGESRATHPAVVSLGVRPQFGDYGPRLLEAYLLDAAVDLYGLTLGVEFVERLREQRRFADVEALQAQMARDVGLARDVLSIDQD